MPAENDVAQVRAAAERIGDAIVARLAEKHPELKTGFGDQFLKWLPLIVAAASLFWTAAIQSKQVEENRRDIEKLETRYDHSSGLMQSVDSRLARIETTLDIITEPRGQASGRADK